MSEMQIMDPTGHLTVSWNVSNRAEVDAAEEAFDKFTDEGYSAFRVGKGGERGVRIDTFDPDAEQMILLPQLRGG